MKIIKQSGEIIDRNAYSPAQLIELAGRTCYKSEDKITDESARDFVFMLAGRKHLSVIEHGALALKVPYNVFMDFKLCDHELIKYLNITGSVNIHAAKYENLIVSGNLRAWLEFLESTLRPQAPIGKMELLVIRYLVHEYCPPAYEAFFKDVPDPTWRNAATGIDVIESKDMTPYEREVHEYQTVKFITNRGVTHELVRHRPASYSQESTRYVNYSSDHIQFIKPVWCPDQFIGKWDSGIGMCEGYGGTHRFIDSCINNELEYKGLLSKDWRPEQAREALPNALKTEIVVTANIKEWKHIFGMRVSKAAHPQIRSLMAPVKEAFAAKYPSIFN